MRARRSPGPSVKDPALYEKLRTDGNSKEKSPRIANAAAASCRQKVSKKGGKSARYDDWAKTDLRRRAKQVGIKGRSKMSKTELVEALQTH